VDYSAEEKMVSLPFTCFTPLLKITRLDPNRPSGQFAGRTKLFTSNASRQLKGDVWVGCRLCSNPTRLPTDEEGLMLGGLFSRGKNVSLPFTCFTPLLKITRLDPNRPSGQFAGRTKLFTSNAGSQLKGVVWVGCRLCSNPTR
jgi:hypothetical protein